MSFYLNSVPPEPAAANMDAFRHVSGLFTDPRLAVDALNASTNLSTMSSETHTLMPASGLTNCQSRGTQTLLCAADIVSDTMENGQEPTTHSLAPARPSSVDAATASNAHVDSPIMYENGQHLLERDPQLPGCRISKAAEEQQAKWRRLMASRPPLERIPRAIAPTKGSKPPLYRHGIPYTIDYMFAYAQRHHLTVDVFPEERDLWEGREVLDFADVQFLSNYPDRWQAIRTCACALSQDHISKRCGHTFETGRPFSMEYDGILSILSNYTMKTRYRRLVGTPERFDKIVAALHEAMNEECEIGGMGELRWWYDWNNHVNIFATLE